MKYTVDQVLKYRMKAQGLGGDIPKTHRLDEVCRKSGGIQAQVISSGIHSLWVRNQANSKEDIINEINRKRSIVKTYAMRGTIHLIPSEDFYIYNHSLMESRLNSSLKTLAKFGIGKKEIDRFDSIVMKTLDHSPMIKKELWTSVKPQLDKKFHTWKDYVWNVFTHCMYSGLICYGEMNGGEVALVRTDQWLPSLKEIDRAEARRLLMKIYLKAFGPATARDFARWTGLNIGESTKILAEIENEITSIEWGDRYGGYMLKSEMENLEKDFPQDVVSLLPNFDTYLMGHYDKSIYLHPNKINQVYRIAGWISPVILCNGRVTGTWELVKNSSIKILRIKRFEKLTPFVKEMIRHEAGKLAEFSGDKIKVRFS